MIYWTAVPHRWVPSPKSKQFSGRYRHFYPRLSVNSRPLSVLERYPLPNSVPSYCLYLAPPLRLIHKRVKYNVLVPTRPLTIIAFVSFAFLFLDDDTACGFFKDMSITPACEILPPKMVIVILSAQYPWLDFLFEIDCNFA
jgi:hypothetical protein